MNNVLRRPSFCCACACVCVCGVVYVHTYVTIQCKILCGLKKFCDVHMYVCVYVCQNSWICTCIQYLRLKCSRYIYTYVFTWYNMHMYVPILSV